MKQFRTYRFALDFVRSTHALDLKAPYRDLFRRAVLSIPLNLAEGSAKTSNADRKRFYEIALGSLREVQALIEILELNQLTSAADCLGAHIYKLCLSL